ncbi:peroxisomal membrane anchor protein conserved region-domain-containing protein [Poronia punctata]|nr:peroxisomal membrane anchor protein conserved region-domain-containing protein [Poronia punctata]
MADSKKASIPAWQQTAPDEANTPSEATKPTTPTLDDARKFLQNEAVKSAGPEEKRAFLKGKGFDDAQITELLDEMDNESQGSTPQPTTVSSPTTDAAEKKSRGSSETEEAEEAPMTPSSSITTATESPSSSAHFVSDTPPIVTYPEFLTKPQRPPPLITPSRLANILAISGATWALLYGLAGLVVRPMVDNLNEARSEYYAHVSEKLGQLVEKLEASVSKVPYKDGKLVKHQDQKAGEDDESVTSDPTELFHRDVGTQTEPPPSLLGGPSATENKSENVVDAQARKLAAIGASLRELALIHTQDAERTANLRSNVGEIRDQLDKLAYPPAQDFSNYSGLGYRSSEPDDEFKKTKDAIRSVKGIFLSARSFPAVTTR